MSYIEELFNLKNKVVVITGATGQLGNEFSKTFSRSGSNVIGIDLKIPEKVSSDIEYFEANVEIKKDLEDVFQKVCEKYGQIDILINNAGVSTFEPFEKRPEDKFEWVMGVNLKGTFFCIQSYVDIFDKKQQNKGVIINIGSVYGIISPDFRIYEDGDRKNSEIYGATKAGVIQMTKYFATHLADRNIRVNAISPGGIYNPASPQKENFIKNYSYRCPMKRMANVEEVTGAALYLASDAATYTTGQNILVDGGMTCW